MPVSTASFAERLRTGAGRRALAFALVLLIEGFLLLLLLSLGAEPPPGVKDSRVTVVNLEAQAAAEEAPEQGSPDPVQQAEERPVPQRPPAEAAPPSQTAEALPPRPAEADQPPPARNVLPTPERVPSAQVPQTSNRPDLSDRPLYGPRSPGVPAAYRDSERVGTAPNGEPLYAAAWYREPRPGELRDYLSTAQGPGWGLIACRTAPDYRVEDCVPISEYPQGSQINRAILAAAWEFRVRPPRVGGRSLVGSWVRIRIDYRIERR